MKRAFMIFLVFLTAITAAKAQAPDGFQFGAGIRVGLPVGDFSNTNSYGMGVEAQGEYGFNNKVSGVVTTGYSTFVGKKITVLGTSIRITSFGYIPLLAGVRVYPVNNLFIGAQAGYGILTGGNNSKGYFNYQPQLGYNGKNIQVAVNFNSIINDGNTLSHIGLTGIYKFGNNRK